MIDLSFAALGFASLLILINAGLSVMLNLGIGKQLLIASLRMVIQLFIVGWVLTALFEQVSLTLTFSAIVIMTIFAVYEVKSRQKHQLLGLQGYAVSLLSISLPVWLITVFALTIILNTDPWYEPRYALPLLGMILGNTMTGVSLGLNTLTSLAYREHASIEAQLSLGHTIDQAMKPITREAMRTGMMPIIISMAATGVVSLPGMMTGQILSGTEPSIAVKYQLLIMFLIAGATAFGVIMAVYLGMHRLTDNRHRLRLDLLNSKEQ